MTACITPCTLASFSDVPGGQSESGPGQGGAGLEGGHEEAAASHPGLDGLSAQQPGHRVVGGGVGGWGCGWSRAGGRPWGSCSVSPWPGWPFSSTTRAPRGGWGCGCLCVGGGVGGAGVEGGHEEAAASHPGLDGLSAQQPGHRVVGGGVGVCVCVYGPGQGGTDLFDDPACTTVWKDRFVWWSCMYDCLKRQICLMILHVRLFKKTNRFVWWSCMYDCLKRQICLMILHVRLFEKTDLFDDPACTTVWKDKQICFILHVQLFGKTNRFVLSYMYDYLKRQTHLFDPACMTIWKVIELSPAAKHCDRQHNRLTTMLCGGCSDLYTVCHSPTPSSQSQSDIELSAAASTLWQAAQQADHHAVWRLHWPVHSVSFSLWPVHSVSFSHTLFTESVRISAEQPSQPWDLHSRVGGWGRNSRNNWVFSHFRWWTELSKLMWDWDWSKNGWNKRQWFGW